MLSRDEVLKNISELKNKRGGFKQKAERNIRLYEDSLSISLDDLSEDVAVGFYKDGSNYDTTINMGLNIIKSCIDTLTSKIASQKVRPYFNTVDGTFKDVKVTKTAQHYFDQIFEEKNIGEVVANCFKNACIFDTGIIYVDPIYREIRNVLPWQVYFRPAEKTYGKLTRIYYERKQFPIILLDEQYQKKLKATGREYIGYGVYYDIANKVYAEMFDTGDVYIHEYKGKSLPFVFLNYSNPIVGSSSNSVVDMLVSIQIEINVLANKVKDASQLTPANTILVPSLSEINVRKLTNGIGNIVSYGSNPNGQTPITVATPSFIDPQYMKTIMELKEMAYELVGISQLSATSQKPSGLNSGIALQTIENIESDRFETQLNSVIRLYVELAKTVMHVYDQDENILPSDRFRSNLKWKDIVEEEENMSIQFSSADAISKDPATKLQILQSLAQSGIIPANQISQYLELPDLEKGYSVTNNAWNAIQTIIERCIEQDVYSVPPFVPISLLQSEIVNTQMSLFAANPVDNEKDISKLAKLFEVSVTFLSQLQAYEAQQAKEMGNGIADGANEELQDESQL